MWEENGKISADLYYRQQRWRKVDSDAWAWCFVSIAGAAYWQALLATGPGENVYLPELRKAIAEEKRIIDSNNKGTPANRLERCDCVIYMDYYPFFCCRRVIRRALLYSPFWYGWGQRRADKLPFYFKFSADNRTDNDGLDSDKSAEIWFFMVHNDRDTAELVRRLRQEAWTQWFRPLVF